MRIFNEKLPIWDLGFRPFFIIVFLSAIITTTLWVLQITGSYSFNFSPLSPNQWHAHEMIFGFLSATIIGFLLTASANWTGTRGINGRLLQLLSILFFLTRIVFWTTPFKNILIYQFLDAILLLSIVVHLTILFLRTRNYRNLIILVPLLVLVYGQITIFKSEYVQGYEFSLCAIRFLLVLIAGRIIPFFTRRALRVEPKWNLPLMEKLTLSVVLLLIFEPLYLNFSGVGRQIWIILTFLAMVLNLYRIVNWRFFPAFRVKILFVLYVGYLWIPIHFGIKLLSHFELISIFGRPDIHSLTYGAMSIMILGMIHRVTLGHTGRLIQASVLGILSYLFLIFGSVIRVFAPLTLPTHYDLWLKISGLLWVVAFSCIGFEIIPMLIAPRIDRKEV